MKPLLKNKIRDIYRYILYSFTHYRANSTKKHECELIRFKPVNLMLIFMIIKKVVLYTLH